MGITGVAAAVSIGTAGYGAYEKSQGSDQQQAAASQQAQYAAMQSQIAGQQANLQSAYSTQQAQSAAQFAGQESALNMEGSANTYAAAQQSYGINQGVIQAQQAVEGLRNQAMELDAHRRQMENLRTAQRAHSLSLFSATGQGAQFGTGYRGGQAQISAQAGVNAAGIRQNLEIGRNIFAQNSLITQGRLAQNDLQLSLARQNASLQTRDAQLRQMYAQTQADQTTGFSSQNAALTTAYAAAGGQINTAQGQMFAGQGQSAFGSSLLSAAPTIFSAGVTANNLFAKQTTPVIDTEGGSAGGLPEQA